jgi:hypothetical protein
MSYWGPVAGHGLVSHDLEMVKAERKQRKPEKAGKIAGGVEAVNTGETGDAYVQIKKKKTPEENQHDEEKKADNEKRPEEFKAQPANTEHD